MDFVLKKLNDAIRKRKLKTLVCGIPGIPPVERAYYQQWPRLNLLLRGEKTIWLPCKEGAREVRLQAGDAFFALADTWETNSWKTAHEVLVIGPRESYLRFAYYELPREREGYPNVLPSHVNHTEKPYGLALHKAVELLNMLALTGENAGQVDLAYVILELAYREGEAVARKPASRAELTLSRITAWMEQHLHDAIDGKTVARTFQLNASYLSQLCHAIHGIGFNRYLNGMRMDRARRLLLSTDLAVYQVAGQCGFPSAAYFIKRFREAHGKSPLVFRKTEAYLG